MRVPTGNAVLFFGGRDHDGNIGLVIAELTGKRGAFALACGVFAIPFRMSRVVFGGLAFFYGVLSFRLNHRVTFRMVRNGDLIGIIGKSRQSKAIDARVECRNGLIGIAAIFKRNLGAVFGIGIEMTVKCVHHARCGEGTIAQRRGAFENLNAVGIKQINRIGMVTARSGNVANGHAVLQDINSIAPEPANNRLANRRAEARTADAR